MAEQPQTMDQLVTSVREVVTEGGTIKVIPTLATTEITKMSSAQRTATSAYLQAMTSISMGLDVAKPGDSVKVIGTDQYYLTNDLNGTFQRLLGHVHDIGSRMR